MSLTIAQARDEMSAMFETAWQADSNTNSFDIHWDDVGDPVPVDRGPWARFNIRHADGFQATLTSPGGQRFRRRGTIIIQLFAPPNEGLSRLDEMAIVAMRTFEGQATDGGVWFRNVRPQEIGVEGSWQQVNVLVDFEYDEIR